MIIGVVDRVEKLEGSDNLSTAYVTDEPYIVPIDYIDVGDKVYIIETQPKYIHSGFSHGILCKTVDEAKEIINKRQKIMPSGALINHISKTPSLGGMTNGVSDIVRAFKDINVKIAKDMLRKYVKTPSYVLMDMEGNSVAYSWVGGQFTVANHKYTFVENYNNVYWRWAVDKGIPDILKLFCEKNNMIGVTLIGKMIGPDIKDNKHGVKEYDFFAHSLVDYESQSAFSFGYTLSTLNSFGLHCYPIMDTNHLMMRTSLDYFAKYKKIKSPVYSNNNGNVTAVIVRPHMEIYDVSYGRISMRVPLD